MKILLLRIILIACGLFLLTGNSFAATTYDWYGGTSTAWNVPGNWKVGGTVQATNYPGSSSSTDIVQIGVNTYSTTKQPVLSTALTNNIASIIFGNNNNNDITLTVNGVTLTVSGNITQNHGAGTISSSTTYITNLAGTGTIYCTGTFQIGSNVAPTTKAVNTTQVSSQINQLTIHGDMLLYAVGNNTSTATNYPTLNLDKGKITLDGQFTSTSVNSPNKDADIYAYGRFNAGTTGNNVTLEITNNQAISSTFTTNFVVDFLYSAGNNGTVIYDSPSGTQTVYTTSNASVGGNPQVYYNLTLSGASTKVASGPNLSIGNNWNTSGGTVDLNTNSADVTVGNDWTNSTTITGGSGNITVSGNSTNSGNLNLAGGVTKIVGTFTNSGNLNQGFGNVEVDGNLTNTGNLTLGAGSITLYGNYTNSGTYTQSTGNTVFAGTSQTLTDNGNGTKFNNVYFNGGGGALAPAKMASGNFSVSSSGILNVVSGSYLNANGNLTLNSDATGSATVAALASGNGITGNVKVQRFIKGSSDVGNYTKRGYRLMSSPVYTGTAGGSNVFDFSYLTNSIYVSGAGNTTNGFNMPNSTTNPTIYLFREDLQPPPSNGTLFYTTYNWKAVTKINNSPAYNIGMPSKNDQANSNDVTYTLPVGNGFLLFFRGDKTVSLTSPYTPPNNVTLSQTGTLNTGTVNVKLWYAPDYPSLGNNFTFSTWTGSTSSLQGGYTLVGNPYASTINWEKYNRNTTKSLSSIYGGGTTAVSTTIYMFNPSNKQYESYQQKSSLPVDTTSIDPGTAQGSASNMIASGQAFFVVATAANQTLSFRETAKTTTQPAAAKLNILMGKPKEFAAQPVPLFRLKLLLDSVNTDEIVIRPEEQASTRFVVNEDAQDMGGEGALVSLSAFSSDNVALSIDFVPYPGKQQQVTPLYVDAISSGSYKLINSQLINLPPLYEMWLKDAFTKDSLKMATHAAYSFTIDKNNPATFGSKRFSVILRQNPDSVYQLLSFTAAKAATGRQVLLVWKTQHEQNYINFTAERSIDGGKTFQVLGGVKATGAGTYSLPDKNPLTGQNLYRLKQEDTRDSITYSKVVPVQYTEGNNLADKVRVYPNPAVSTINVAIAADVVIKPPYTIQISNSAGLVIRQVNSADANWQSSVAGLLPGTYIVKVHNSTDNSFVGDTKFVKL